MHSPPITVAMRPAGNQRAAICTSPPQPIDCTNRFAAHTTGVARPAAHDPGVYAAALLDLGLSVDAWETTYLHLLQGPDPVFAWISGTGARPVLQALPAGLREEFTREYQAVLRAAYPRGRHGTVLPFRRTFVVARVPDPA